MSHEDRIAPPGRAPAASPSRSSGPVLVKCVAWDLDNTLLSGVYVESGESPPEPDPVMAGLLAELGSRGILHAIASKNPPAAAAYAERALGRQFAAVECGWGRKADALARIADGLGIGIDALAFVDDDPYQRAEVSARLPAVTVLSPEEAVDAAGWPEFSPPTITDEARRRGELYAARRRRQEAAHAFGGGREDFLRAAGTRVAIARAAPADAPRLHELSVRTHQFNSATRALDLADATSMIVSGSRDVITVRLRDAFSDDGIVGGCVVERRADASWSVELLMMSCRAMGRGVIGAVLAWLTREAARQGAAALEVPCVLNDRNVPLRLALTGAGFRADGPPPAGEPALFRRDVGGPPPGLPSWVTAPGDGAR